MATPAMNLTAVGMTPRDLHHRELAAVRSEADKWRETARQLLAMLAPAGAFPFAWRLSASEARTLGALLSSPRGRCRAALHVVQAGSPAPTSEEKMVDKTIQRIRRKIAPFVGAEAIEAMRGDGYRLNT